LCNFLSWKFNKRFDNNVIKNNLVLLIRFSILEQFYNIFTSLIISVWTVKEDVINFLLLKNQWLIILILIILGVLCLFNLINFTNQLRLKFIQVLYKELLNFEGTYSFNKVLAFDDSIKILLLKHAIKQNNLEYFHHTVLIVR
jgi:hypothetical protein